MTIKVRRLLGTWQRSIRPSSANCAAIPEILPPETIILFESPYRLEKTLNQLLEHLGNRSVVVGRELTKLYEEVIRGNLSDIIVHFSKSKIKGELVIMIGKDDDRINF